MAASMVNGMDRAAHFYDSSLGKKVVMAVTGFILFGYVVAHMAGNLQIFLGKQVINDYAAMLHHNLGLLWGVRFILLISVSLHIWSAVQLSALKRDARPVAYVKPGNIQGSFASRSMTITGVMIVFFVVYHLLHLTTGTVHPQFEELNAFDNVVNGFRSTPAALAYIIAMLLLGTHLSHGIWSMFQSLGFSHPRYTPILKKASGIVAWLIIAGFISVPVSIMLGIVG